MLERRREVGWALLVLAGLLVAGAAGLAFTEAKPQGYDSGCGVAAEEFLGTEDEYGFRDELCIDPARERMTVALACIAGAGAVLWISSRVRRHRPDPVAA